MTPPTPADYRAFLAIVSMQNRTPVYDGLPHPDGVPEPGTAHARVRAWLEQLAQGTAP